MADDSFTKNLTNIVLKIKIKKFADYSLEGLMTASNSNTKSFTLCGYKFYYIPNNSVKGSPILSISSN